MADHAGDAGIERAPAKRTLDRRTIERIAVLLDRVVPWIARVERPARGLLVVGAVSAAWLVWLLARGVDPDGTVDWLGLLLLGVIVLAPAVVLLGFVVTLRQLMGLPEQLRTLPETTRDQAARFSGAIDKLRQPRQSGVRGSVSGLWGARGVFFELAGLAEPFVGLAGLMRLPFLILVGVAALAVGIEIVLAVILVLVKVGF